MEKTERRTRAELGGRVCVRRGEVRGQEGRKDEEEEEEDKRGGEVREKRRRKGGHK